MTGPEHYRAAEQLLDDLYDGATSAEQDRMLATAQVHATLAQAAATAMAGFSANGMTSRDLKAWREAAGEFKDGA